MKKRIIVLICAVVLALPSLSFAAKGKKGPSESAYKHANENASFKRDANWKEQKKAKKAAEKTKKDAHKREKKVKETAKKDAEKAKEKADKLMEKK